MHDHGQIYSGIEGASPGRFAALVTNHEVVTLGKLGEERAQALGRAPAAAIRLPDSGRSRLSGTGSGTVHRFAAMNDCSAAGAAIQSRLVNWRSRP